MKKPLVFALKYSFGLFFLLSFISCNRRKESADNNRWPNVVVILTDDQRWNALSVNGNPHLKTPHIDKLAAEEVNFKNYFCTTSLCSPSRASILSGKYAHAHGVVDNFTEFPADLPSFPSVLQKAGYETAYIGKWHMGEGNDEPRPGYDYFVTHKGQGKYYDTKFNINGAGGKVVKGYYTTVVSKLANDWLQKDHLKTFMLILGHKVPHSFYPPSLNTAKLLPMYGFHIPAMLFP